MRTILNTNKFVYFSEHLVGIQMSVGHTCPTPLNLQFEVFGKYTQPTFKIM